jgi:hypothetical protein
VFLLHGKSDALIPAREAGRLAARLRAQTRVRLLVTDAITHAETSRRGGMQEVMKLASFWGDILAG